MSMMIPRVLLPTAKAGLSALAGLMASAFVAIGLPASEARAQGANPLEAVVGIEATIPPEARTADSLGTRRAGAGVVIREDGLVLTIGYLILEAISTELTLNDGRTVPAEVVGYDHETGFGVLRALAPLGIEPIGLGESAALGEDDRVLVAGFGGSDAVIGAEVVSRRDFAGYWEYLLPDAIFTAPPFPSFGGAALIGRDGRLLGIGSLIVADAAEPDTPTPGNMFVPIDALKPILGSLVRTGRREDPARPWLGMQFEALRGRIFVKRVSSGSPADKAGIRADDVVVAVAGEPVGTLIDLYRKVWSLGPAGVEVPLTVLTDGGTAEVTVTSGDRYDYLKLRSSY
ncbi:MAG TPA: S1C family serine protease [Kiloniellales bacterium]|nr:S1C family serine protease [Kiloniellales bacterium]